MNKINIKDINARLQLASLPPITERQLQYILSSSNQAQSFWNAFNDLPIPAAVTYLSNLFSNVGEQSLQNHHNPQKEFSNKQKKKEKDEKFKDHSFTVYGKNAAICFNRSETVAGFPTILIDAAKAKGPKSYDWENRLSLQITKNELPTLIAVLYGMLASAEFKYHGPAKDKGGKITNQGKNFFLEFYAKGVKHAVPMHAEDSFYVAMLCLDQLKKSYPNTELKVILDTIASTTVRLKSFK